jgi:hypothetical protein
MSNEIKLRPKTTVLETLPKAVKQNDKDHVRKIYPAHGNLIKNEYRSDDNPATWIGWIRTEKGEVIRLEGETRVNRKGSKSMALKAVTIPNHIAVQLDLDDPKVPNYVSQETQDFLDQ